MKAFGSSLAQQLRSGDVLALIGDLGAGKTHLTQGIASALGHSDAVTSPTFALVNEYSDCTPELIHFDWYRMEQPEELLAIGWEDYLERDAILVIEWPDRFPEMIPAGSHCIHIEHLETGRRLSYAHA
jgi:tRNA threonylcarbamoyladenosine biosynthesis protein TsaE